MTALLGTSVTLEELTEVVGEGFKDPVWLEDGNRDILLSHDFRDPRDRLDLEARHSSNRIMVNGSQISTTTHYQHTQRVWLSDGQILRSLPADWRGEQDWRTRKAAPDLVESHDLRIQRFLPHQFIATAMWRAPDYMPRAVRTMAIYGPMLGPEQVAFIVDLVRRSIADEAKTLDDALARTKGTITDALARIAKGRPLPSIAWNDQATDSYITTYAKIRTLDTDLNHKTLNVTGHYRTPLIERFRPLHSSDEAAVEKHYRYLEISERQGGLLRLSALARWLCGNPDGTFRNNQSTFTKNLLGSGTVKVERKKGRIEATYRSGKLTIQTGKITIDIKERYPETVIASMKGRPLSDLLELEGLSRHIVVTSLQYEGDRLVGRLRDTSQYYVDGEIIIDKLKEDTNVPD